MTGECGRVIFYYICFLVHLIGLTYHVSQINLESHRTYGGRFKFLTFINMLLQFIYFNMAAVTGFFELLKKRKSEIFSSICDFTFACFVLPIGLTVSILFWGLYAADPYSCQTPEEAKFIPDWLNHYMHSFPFVTAMFELWLIEHKYPPRTKGLLSVLAFGVAYISWVLWIAFSSDIWVYPFLENMSWPFIGAFFACALFFSTLLYLFGEWVALRRWHHEPFSLDKKKL